MVLTSGSSDSPRAPYTIYPRSLPIPEIHLRDLPAPNMLVNRDPSSTSSSSTTSNSSACGPNDTCYFKPSDNTLPIVLGVVIPLTVAFCVLIFLHRRHVKKLRREDAEDKNKSLDFGMSGVQFSEKHRKGRKAGADVSQMSTADAMSTLRHDRGGISLDMTMSSPYLLPPELHQSRESLHSLSRSLNTGDDKYRATDFIPDDGSIRSPSSMRSHWDNGSTYTGSSRPRLDSESTKNLIPYPSRSDKPMPQIRKPVPIAKDGSGAFVASQTEDHPRDSADGNDHEHRNSIAAGADNTYPSTHVSNGEKKLNHETAVAELESQSHTPEPYEMADAAHELSSKRTSHIPDAAGFNFGLPNGVQELPSRYSRQSYREDLSHDHPKPVSNEKVAVVESKELPLPPRQQKRQSSVYEDNLAGFQNHPNAYAWPAENGQMPPINEHQVVNPHYDGHATSNTPGAQRGSRIGATGPKRGSDHQSQSGHAQPESHQRGNSRSSQQRVPNVTVDRYTDDYYDDGDEYDIDDYKEVLGYDPRLLHMGMRPLPPDDPSENPEERALKIRSFYKEYFDEAAKPDGGNRLSYFDGSENYIEDYYGTSNPSPYGSRGPSMVRPATQQQRHRAMSNGSYGPRAYSSASGRYGRPPVRPQPRMKLPPPKALTVLPTPHMLKDDSMLPNPMDYAPPQIYKNQRSGTPDNLRGGMRPYSPSTRAFNPLVSSFDDLAVLPSPHQLRKSGLFTSLDFAPPRFQAKDSTMSDAGSIRSNRSGVSALHQHNIRTGAYRVSRLPREVAGTRDELADALRPQWNMNR